MFYIDIPNKLEEGCLYKSSTCVELFIGNILRECLVFESHSEKELKEGNKKGKNGRIRRGFIWKMISKISLEGKVIISPTEVEVQETKLTKSGKRTILRDSQVTAEFFSFVEN